MTDGPIRVTLVVFDFNGGGMETLVAEMAGRFRGTNVHVSLVTLGGRAGRLGESTRDRFDQFHVVAPSRGASMLVPLGVARAIRETRADVVHIHSGCWLKGARAARLAGVRRVIFTEHGREHDDPRLMRWLDRLASRETDAIVGVSERVARYLVSAVGVDASKTCVIHNGVNTSAFTSGPAPASLRASLGVPPDAVVIGSVGRLEAVKAYDQLLNAAKLLRTRLRRPFVVAICGDGSQRHALMAQATRLGLDDVVRLPGWTQRPVDFYRLLDVFVLSSLSEGQSVSLLEAMACGVAPVVTDVGANAEMLGPELRAQIVPVADPEALAAAIAATASAGTGRIGSLVQARARDHYSLDRMVGDYERLYRAVDGIPADLRVTPAPAASDRRR